MVEELTVLLVGDDEPDEKLVQQLEKKSLNVEISAQKELGSLLALVEPHIVVHIGKEGAEATVRLLKETEEVRRIRLIILAERDALTDLRKLDRTVVVSLLADDIAPSVVAARVVMLAKKGPEKSLRPPSAMAKPPLAATPPTPSIQEKDPSLPRATGPSAFGGTVPGAPAVAPASRFGLASAATVPPKASIPRADSLKPKAATALSTGAPVAGNPAPFALQAKTPRPVGPPGKETDSDSAGPVSEFPTMSIDISIPSAARPTENEARVVLADDDVTRADLIACALRDAGVPTRIVPLDAAKTHWPLVREFAPTIVMGDGNALKTSGQIWLQLFQADQALRKAKLVAVPFEHICQVDQGWVNLRPLVSQIPQITPQLDPSDRSTSEPAPFQVPPSASLQPSPAQEAPIPFADDDPDEFERLTVARPIDAPLPTEATRSRLPDLPQPTPAAGAPASSAVTNAEISAKAWEGGPRPVFDSLAPVPDPEQRLRPAAGAQKAPAPIVTESPKTPAAVEAPVEPPVRKSGGGKFAAVAILLLALGGAGGWFAFGKKLPAFFGRAPEHASASSSDKAKTPPAPTISEIPDAPPPDENAPSPEELLWRVPSNPAPHCDELVKNLEELKVGGLKQAAVSLAKARQSMVLGRLDDALTLLCEAVLVHPESLALEELAALYLTKGSPDQAFEWQKKAVALRPDRTRTLELSGDIYSQLGNVPEAKAAFIASLKVKPDDEKTLKAVSKQFAEQAGVEFRAGAFDAATLLYRRSATLDAENAEALAGLAATSASAGNADAAGRWAEKTLLIDEGHHVALVVQAALATEAGDTEKAKALTERAIERNQNYLPAHQLREKLKTN